jgi:phosphohistidine phosphatase
MNTKTKTLILLRHGKSDWDMEEFDDHKRKLTEQGIVRTERVIAYLREIDMPIDRIVCSPATRAFDTGKMLQEKLHLPPMIVENQLYPGSVDQIFDLVISQPDEIKTMLIVGHNPGLTYFAQKYMNAEIDNLPTSGLVCCKYFSSSWPEFAMVERKLNFVVFPKKLK